MSIRYVESKKLFQIETAHSMYQMKINEIGILLHTYYGEKLGNMDMSYQIPSVERGFSGNPYEISTHHEVSLDLLPQEYTSSGVGDHRISSIDAISNNGSRSIDFRYKCHKLLSSKYSIEGLPYVRAHKDDVCTLEIILIDEIIGLEIKLLYGVFESKDIITRTVELTNIGKTTIILEKVDSICIDFLNTNYDLIHFQGRHCMERQFEQNTLNHDIQTISSKRGMSSHQNNPYVILTELATTEDIGNCYGFMLMYSGNHKTEIEVDQTNNTRLVMGINDDYFRWELEPNSVFHAPETILTFSNLGLNKLSQNFHNIIRENICPIQFQNIQRPILINNWEATYFDFDYTKIIKLAKQALEVGVNMFVLDDGWFGNRNNDNAGLGDWIANESKLPGGLTKLSKDLKAIGMNFGLWFEPEMINENSELYKSHPEWVLQDPSRKPVISRNQMVLDLSNIDVQNYIFKSIDKILEGSEIAYIKWDFNRSLSNVYSNALPNSKQGEVSHKFICGTYSLLERLNSKYPNTLIEGCAGGGGRFDAGMLYYCPQIWCSDNTDPIARLKIQKGTSYGYPVSTMGSHVSAAPNHQTGRDVSLKTRGIVAMSGTFGYELDFDKLTDIDKSEITKQIENFKKYYWIIQKGTYFRLTNNKENSFYEAWEFVSKDKTKILLNMVVTNIKANSEIPRIKLKGLEKHLIYHIEGTKEKFTGAALMYAGYVFSLNIEDYQSFQILLVLEK